MIDRIATLLQLLNNNGCMHYSKINDNQIYADIPNVTFVIQWP